jgi:hypothetical protein
VLRQCSTRSTHVAPLAESASRFRTKVYREGALLISSARVYEAERRGLKLRPKLDANKAMIGPIVSHTVLWLPFIVEESLFRCVELVIAQWPYLMATIHI